MPARTASAVVLALSSAGLAADPKPADPPEFTVQMYTEVFRSVTDKRNPDRFAELQKKYVGTVVRLKGTAEWVGNKPGDVPQIVRLTMPQPKYGDTVPFAVHFELPRAEAAALRGAKLYTVDVKVISFVGPGEHRRMTVAEPKFVP